VIKVITESNHIKAVRLSHLVNACNGKMEERGYRERRRERRKTARHPVTSRTLPVVLAAPPRD